MFWRWGLVKEDMEPIAKQLINKAKILLTEVKGSNDYDEFTVYDECGVIREPFLKKEKRNIVDNLLSTLEALNGSERTYLFGAIVAIEIEAEEKMRAGEGWDDPAAEDKRACVLLREMRDHAKKGEISKGR